MSILVQYEVRAGISVKAKERIDQNTHPRDANKDSTLDGRLAHQRRSVDGTSQISIASLCVIGVSAGHEAIELRESSGTVRRQQ